jgi:hypothetical protein
MTAKERNLWLGVVAVIIASLVYNFILNRPESTAVEKSNWNSSNIESARRLLASRNNIGARSKAVMERLQTLEQKFLDGRDPEQAQINLLTEVERLISSSELSVQQKNAVRVSEQQIGVALEGTTSAAALFNFLYQASSGRYGLRTKRLQIHSLADKKQLSYQVVLVTPLLEKKGPQ